MTSDHLAHEDHKQETNTLAGRIGLSLQYGLNDNAMTCYPHDRSLITTEEADMSTPRVTLGELDIEGVLGKDPFGLLFEGRDRASGDQVVVLGITPPQGQKLSVVKIQQAMRGLSGASYDHVAPVLAMSLLDDTESEALAALAQEDLETEEITSPKAYIAYQTRGAEPLSAHLPLMEESERVNLIRSLLTALTTLHKHRLQHLALSLRTLWINESGLLITHCGAATLMKRGLSLSKASGELDAHLADRLPYVSPEELAGKLTHASCDLYSAAVIAHEVLSETSILDMSLDVAAQVDQVQSGLASLVSPSLQGDWRDWVTRGMGLTTRERFSSAHLMLKQLDELIASTDGAATSKPKVDPGTPNQAEEADLASEVSVEAPADGEAVRASLLMQMTSSDELNEFDSTISEQSDLLSEVDLSSAFDSGQVSAPTLETDLGAVAAALREADEDQVDHPLDLSAESATDQSDVHRGDVSDKTDEARDESSSGKEVDIAPAVDSDEAEESAETQEVDQAGQRQDESSQDETSQDAVPVESVDAPIDLPADADKDSSEGTSESVESAVQSLRSKLSPTSTPSKTADLGQTTTDSVGELAFGGGGDEMAFGFSQNDADEHTFLEFGDIDEKTVFEEDLDASVQASHKTMMGLPAQQLFDGAPTPAPSLISGDITVPAISKASATIQTPDFLEDYQGELEPSRVVPIPSVSKPARPPSEQEQSSPQGSAAEATASTPTPQASTQEPAQGPGGSSPIFSASTNLMTSAEPVVRPINEVDLPPIPTPSGRAHQPDNVGSALDWPGNESQQYVPPGKGVSSAKGRHAPKLKENKSIGSRIISAMIFVIVIGGGGIGIYWASSHWDQVSSLLNSESAESLNISTNISSTPPMSVQIGDLSPKAIPTYFSYNGEHSVGDQLRFKFTWPVSKKRSRRSRRGQRNRPKWKLIKLQVEVLPGDASLYFIGDQESDSYAQTVITSLGDQLEVSLDNQSLGQTPLIIAGPSGRTLSLQVRGESTQESREIKLGDPQTSRLQFSSPASP